MLNYRHSLGNCLISLNYCIKNRGVQIDRKLYFHHVDFSLIRNELAKVNSQDNIILFTRRQFTDTVFCSVRSKIGYGSIA
jgi:hypothetical protein